MEEFKQGKNKTFGDVVTAESEIIEIEGYEYDSCDKESIEITEGTNEINLYYAAKTYNYTVHYFYDGVENTAKMETLEAKFGSEISTYPTEGKSEGEKVLIKAQTIGKSRPIIRAAR